MWVSHTHYIILYLHIIKVKILLSNLLTLLEYSLSIAGVLAHLHMHHNYSSKETHGPLLLGHILKRVVDMLLLPILYKSYVHIYAPSCNSMCRFFTHINLMYEYNMTTYHLMGYKHSRICIMYMYMFVCINVHLFVYCYI